MKKYFSIFLILVLLLPTPVKAAVSTEGMGIMKQGNTFVFTTEYDGKVEDVTFDGSKMELVSACKFGLTDCNIDDFWSQYKLEEYLDAYLALQNYDDELAYKHNQDGMFAGEGIAHHLSKLSGSNNDSYSSDKEAILDLLLMSILFKLEGMSDYKELRDLKGKLNSVNYSRTTTSAALSRLNGMGIDSLKELKPFLEEKIGEIAAEASSEAQSTYVAENYGKTITKDNMNISNYANALRIAIFMTWDDAPSLPVYEQVIKALDIEGKNRIDVGKELWEDINSSGLSEAEKASIYTVFKMRNSVVSGNDIAEPSLGGMEEDQYAFELAEGYLEEFMELLNNSYPDVTSTLKSRYSYDLRLKFHYYHSRTSKKIEKAPYVEGLTLDNGADAHYFGVEPPNFQNNVMNAKEYTNFMNVMNELPFAREFVLGGVLSRLSDDNANTNEVIEAAGYLRSLKAGIVFLESIGDTSLQHAIDYWYEGEPSMETIYQQVISMNILEYVDAETVEVDDEEPLRNFFSLLDGKMNLYLRTGFAQSAKYIPLKTNVYEPYTYTGIENTKFFSDFHYVWGYNRKALYIDTNKRAATNTFTTGKSGSLKVATLKDFLEGDRDIVLYSDTEFYNDNKLLSIEEKATNKIDEVKATVEETEEVIEDLQSKWETAEMIVNFDLVGLVKTLWDSKLKPIQEKITQYAVATKDFLLGSDKDEDDLFLSKEAIDTYLTQEDYSVLKPFAVTSAIFRDSKTSKFIEAEGREPVFVASKDLGKMTGAEYKDQASVINYAIVQNLRSNRLIDYKSTLDYNSPLFLDVYGNIITSTGYVVVPAASNANYYNEYVPYTAGFISTYGEEYLIPAEFPFPDTFDGSAKDKESKVFELSEDGKHWVFKQLQINSLVDLNGLSTADEETLNTLYTLVRKQIDVDALDSTMFINNVLLEVMRGAPMEDIDLEGEGLVLPEELSKSGVIQAHKLAELKKTLDTKSQNSILSLPNPAFIEGLEYVVFFIYKMSAIAGIILIFIQIFTMTMRANFSIFSILKMCAMVGLIVGFVYLVPKVFEWTYYETNKALLQDETVKISLLNLEKQEAGVEVDVSSLNTPEIETELLVKLEEIELSWIDLIQNIAFSSIFTSLQDVYDEEANSELVVLDENVQVIGDGVYLDVMDIYGSSNVVFEPTFKNLYQQTSGTIPLSFYTPYYVFIDSIVANVNSYNATNNMFSYTTNTYEGGKVKSIGLSKGFLTSDKFMSEEDEYDFLYLRNLYGISNGDEEFTPFSDDELGAIRESLWVDLTMDDEEVMENIKYLNEEAKAFVVENRDLLGRISDESFVKVMAMHLALEYNRTFGVGKATTIELFNLSPDDLIRLSISNQSEVMEGSMYSYSRYIYEVSGQVGVYLAAILEVILFVSGWVKPLAVLAMFIVLFVSVFIYRLVLKVDTDTTKGVAFTVLYLCLTNLLYAVMLKASLMLPKIGLPAGICLVIQIAMHVVFLLAIVWILSLVVRDWTNFGANNFSTNHLIIKEGIQNKLGRNPKNYERKNPTEDAWEYYDNMKEQDRRRAYTIQHDDNLSLDSRTAKEMDSEFNSREKSEKSAEKSIPPEHINMSNARDISIEQEGRYDDKPSEPRVSARDNLWKSETPVQKFEDGKTVKVWRYEYPDGSIIDREERLK